ncbi:MAG: DUF4743 domain-containing protein [Rhodospirillales bacterium]|nr:DUF4743 domain-containing protein [Rhodospirillales bacterium]
MSFLERINACKSPDLSGYLPFIVEGATLGYVKPDFAKLLQDFPDTFTVKNTQLGLNEKLGDPESRTAAVDEVLLRLMELGVISGWRGEKYKVATSFAAPAVFDIERAAVALFGTIGYGVHLNGVVQTAGGLSMWVGRRSLSKPTGPGKLDQIVAGGQPIGISLMDNLIKECGEEADIPADIAAGSIPVGAITYTTERPEGLRRDVLFNYDLVLPEGFKPCNTDGEIEDFYLMSMDEVAARVHDTDDFKFNCAIVVIDFLIRHGYIEPDHPDYIDLINGLHGLD